MKKTDINNFDGPLVARNGSFSIFCDDYLNSMSLNKIIILPLQVLRGNIENSIGRDQILFVTSGLGSMEVNGSTVPVRQGDFLIIKANEPYTIRNDALDAVIQFVSILDKK